MKKHIDFFRLIIVLNLVLAIDGSAQNVVLPDVNQEIVTYVKSVIGQKVGRGECWDLADAALTNSQAQFDKSSKKTLYIFGKEYNPKKESILPGDIIQFTKVVIKYQDGNKMFTENYDHHTAIVFQVAEDKNLEIAHQNTGFSGKKVGLSKLRLEDVQKGKMKFYRPIPK